MQAIKITCKSDTFLPFTQIQTFQGALKTRTDEDVDHLMLSFEKHGFSFPIFIWRQPDGTCSCLDGHGRLLALTKLQQEGYVIPDLPVVYIDAKDEKEARTKLLQINVTSGKFTESGFKDLVKDIPDLDLTTLKYPELDLEKIDLELKILLQAQSAIQQTGVAEWDFTNVDYGIPNIPEGMPNIIAPPPPIVNAPPAPPSSYTEGTPIAEPSPDPETDVKEIVVHCQDCGQAFLYRYRKDGQPVEQTVETAE